MGRAPSRPLPGMAAMQPPKRTKARRAGLSTSDLENKLVREIRALALPPPVRELMFAEALGRRWRFDLAWPDRFLAFEVEGGEWSGGRHGRGGGMTEDCVKYAEAALLGWTVIRVTGTMVKDGRALKLVWRALGGVAAYSRPAPRDERPPS